MERYYTYANNQCSKSYTEDTAVSQLITSNTQQQMLKVSEWDL